MAPEMLLRATLLRAFFSVRSERQLIGQIDYNLLFRWFRPRGLVRRLLPTRRTEQDAREARGEQRIAQVATVESNPG